MALLTAAAVLLLASSAFAEFSPPPDDRRSLYSGDDPESPERARHDQAGLGARFHIGPATLLAPMRPGLIGSVDLGRGAVGARLSAAFLGAESERGLAAYTGELWVDFRSRAALHPVLGAGASYLRGRGIGSDESVGAGSLRGALEYELPIDEADARIGLSVLAWVPAIGTERTRPWAAAALTVGVGF